MKPNSHIPTFLSIAVLIACGSMLTAIVIAMDRQLVYIWDEAIYANNSLEMATNGHWLVYTRDGLADHYNSKPPLAIWLQAIFLQLFGFHEFPLRLPTLLALLGLLALIFRFCHRRGLPLLAVAFVCFIILTTPGLIRPHVFLTADLDGILVFFTSALCLEVLLLSRKQAIPVRSVYLGFLLLTGGFITKSVAILLLLPSILMILWINGLLVSLMRMRSVYFGLAGFLGIIAAYYGTREYLDPGYCAVVWQSEIVRYTTRVMSWHEQPFSFYMVQIAERFNPYYTIFTVIIGAAWLYVLPVSANRAIVFNSFVMALVYLLVISIPSVKLEWYDAPLYPLWSLGTGLMCYDLSIWFFTKYPAFKFQMVTAITIMMLLAWPAHSLFSKQFWSKRELLPQEMEAAALLKADQQFHLNHYNVLMHVEDQKIQHMDVLNFYIKVFTKRMHKKVDLMFSVNEAIAGDTLVVTHSTKIDSLAKQFHLKGLNAEQTFMVLEAKQ